ncbi:hypothetical protein SNE40_017618 [Patella caerulea]|uniref:C-type lectin domain-containing protein n=1 Tax=Patella caerulea TaxID=87958 RepID=A0AAN8PG50_PATCE
MFEIRPAFVLGFLSLIAALGVEPVKDPSDFFSAASDCESRGLSLPVAKTDQEYAAFLRVLETSKIDQDIWLGIYKPDEDSQYRWLGQNAEQGELLTTYWAMDEPNHLPKEHCVRLKAEDNYLWNTRICSDKSEYVCVDYMKSEYDFEVVTRRTTYENAREDCQSKGKDLLMIKTQHKQDEITKFLTDQSTVM